jgi:DNA invertase Pin-like site-specific DNA recombinase
MKAVQYLRTSRAKENGALEYQATIIAQYAHVHGFEILRTYRDENLSGLDVAHRPGFRRLLRDVLSPAPGFGAILVYDVSRWGRFQDVDESAYYEFLCKSAGVAVHYCADTFSNDGSMTATIVKSLRRSMAGEYVRELSNRVWNAQARVAANGCKLGGEAGYGLRRQLVGPDGRSKGILRRGEWKCASKDRVMYCHGPREEVLAVRSIFRLFVEKRWAIRRIVQHMQTHGPSRPGAVGWDYQTIYRILNNPKYAGCIVFNRTTKRFRSSGHVNPRCLWIVRQESFAPIVTLDVFDRAQLRFQERTARRTDEQLLQGLRSVLESKGTLSEALIKATPGIPCPNTFRRRFTSLPEAYRSVTTA